jgi:hypothetical protein
MAYYHNANYIAHAAPRNHYALVSQLPGKFLRLLLNGPAQSLIDLGEHLVGSVASLVVCATKVNRYVPDEIFLLPRRAAEDIPKTRGLHKVFIVNVFE